MILTLLFLGTFVTMSVIALVLHKLSNYTDITDIEYGCRRHKTEIASNVFFGIALTALGILLGFAVTCITSAIEAKLGYHKAEYEARYEALQYGLEHKDELSVSDSNALYVAIGDYNADVRRAHLVLDNKWLCWFEDASLKDVKEIKLGE